MPLDAVLLEAYTRVLGSERATNADLKLFNEPVVPPTIDDRCGITIVSFLFRIIAEHRDKDIGIARARGLIAEVYTPTGVFTTITCDVISVIREMASAANVDMLHAIKTIGKSSVRKYTDDSIAYIDMVITFYRDKILTASHAYRILVKFATRGVDTYTFCRIMEFAYELAMTKVIDKHPKTVALVCAVLDANKGAKEYLGIHFTAFVALVTSIDPCVTRNDTVVATKLARFICTYTGGMPWDYRSLYAFASSMEGHNLAWKEVAVAAEANMTKTKKRTLEQIMC